MLLKRGATRVVALDVGHGQIDWTLRNDPRVVVIEHFNARHLQPSDLPGPVDIVTIDVSFISLRQILPVVPRVLRQRGDVVALVKPQFEAGRSEIRKGVIRDTAIQARVVDEVSAAAREVGLTPVASTTSPITGAKGNVEFLLHLRSCRRRDGARPGRHGTCRPSSVVFRASRRRPFGGSHTMAEAPVKRFIWDLLL